MSFLNRKFRPSVAAAGIAVALLASPLNVFASDGEMPSPGTAWAARSALSPVEDAKSGHWLLAGLVVVGLVIVGGAAGSLAGSFAHLAGWAAAVPGAVAGIGLGATLLAGGVLVRSSGFSTSAGATTSTLSSFLNLLFGSTGSSSSGSVTDSLLSQNLGSYGAATLATLGVLVGIGAAATLYLRRRPPSPASPFGGALGGLLGLGIAFGVAGGFSLVVANETTSEVPVVDLTTGQAVGSILPGAAGSLTPEPGGGEIPGISPVTVEPTATADPGAPPMVTVLQPANCRFGPGTVYPVATSFVEGTVLRIVGRNGDGTWWQASYIGTPGLCWLSNSVVTPSGDTSGVTIVADPPTPTVTASPLPASQGCFWNGVCLHRPCGHNEPTGTVCWY